MVKERKYWLEKNDFDHLHDVLFDLTDKHYIQEEMLDIIKILPEDIKIEIDHWGIADTCVRDSIYEYLERNL